VLNEQLRRGIASCVCVLACALSVHAHAEPSHSAQPLSAVERGQLLAGGRIERPLSRAGAAGRTVGGIGYQVVSSSPAEVVAALLDVSRLPQMLPNTRSARLVARAEGLAYVELEQGVAPFIARYTIVLQPVPGSDLVRFWLDPRFSHDIEDVFGFFRVEPLGPQRSLLTAAVAVDLGDGLLSSLFERRVQALVLRSVTSIRDFLEPPRWASTAGK